MNPDSLARDVRLFYELVRDAFIAGGRDPWESHTRALVVARGRWQRELSAALQHAVEQLSVDGPPRWAGAGRVAHFYPSGVWSSRCGRPRFWTPGGDRACKTCVRLLAVDLMRSC